MIRLENVLKTSLQGVLKMSWRRLEGVLNAFFQDILKASWQEVLKMSWRHLEGVFKTSWRRLEEVWPKWKYWSWPRRLEDALKTSSEEVSLRRIYSSWSRRQDKCLLGKYCDSMRTASLQIYWVLHWSGTYDNKYGSMLTASSHISWVLRWCGTCVAYMARCIPLCCTYFGELYWSRHTFSGWYIKKHF